MAVLLILLALSLRILIPAGFMPAQGKGLAITLCTGAGATPAWIDEYGKLHKGKPGSSGSAADHPCAFAGFGAAFDLPALLSAPTLLAAPVALGLAPMAAAVAIGRGLAAPPPPQTGPPITF